MNRHPMDGTFELTLRCNLRCQMCMLRREDSQELRSRELTCDQWLELAQQACEAGTMSLLLTGGEPMLRKDFIPLYEGIYAKGFLLTLYTNATLVTPQIMECLKKHPPHRIGVTFYGVSNSDYNTVCGCPDGFDRAMDGLKQLLSLPSAVEVRFTPVRQTIGSIDYLDKLIFDRFGIHVTLSARIFQAVRGGCMNPVACRPTPEQTVDTVLGRMEDRIRESIPLRLRHGIQLRIMDQCSLPAECNSLLGCQAGISSYTISWDGKLLGCQLLDRFYTDALEEGFLQAWTRFPETVHLPPHPCEDCEHLQSCTLCPAVAVAETGRLDGVPEYICEITKLTQKRKEEFNL